MISIYKEIFKRKILDTIKSERLNTPMQNVLFTLKAYQHPCENFIALDIFGMHGLWNTKDFAPYCKSLEMWDIDPLYTKFAKKIIPFAKVVTGNSIDAINSGKLLKDKYNLIVSDNFVAGEYGGKYFEHFDFFDNIFRYSDKNTILILNVVTNIEKLIKAYHLDKEKVDLWIEKRIEFYDESDVINISAKKLLYPLKTQR